MSLLYLRVADEEVSTVQRVPVVLFSFIVSGALSQIAAKLTSILPCKIVHTISDIVIAKYQVYSYPVVENVVPPT